jgi:hypothetical protein
MVWEAETMMDFTTAIGIVNGVVQAENRKHFSPGLPSSVLSPENGVERAQN